jgi:hypothetical protein
MKPMLNHSSATVREQTPHANEDVTQTTKPATNGTDFSNNGTGPKPSDLSDLKRRAQAIINDKSIDPNSRKIISYALLINDPWLPELVRNLGVGENIAEPSEYSRAAAVVEDLARAETCNEEKVEELASIICRANDRSAAALVVLMRTLEKSIDAKLLVNKAKHFAFARCAEANLLGMVDTQTAVSEAELLAGKLRLV